MHEVEKKRTLEIFRHYVELESQLQTQMFEYAQLRAKIQHIRQRKSYKIYCWIRARYRHIFNTVAALWRQPLPEAVPFEDLEFMGIRGGPTELLSLPNIAVHVHVYFLENLIEIIDYLNNMPCSYFCYVTTNSEQKKAITQIILEDLLKEKNFRIILCKNQGRDVGPWLIEMTPYHQKHDLWCHIHTKKSIHLDQGGTRWREHLLRNLLGSTGYITGIVNLFAKQTDLGLIFPPIFSEVNYPSTQCWADEELAQAFLARLGYQLEFPVKPVFSAGNMLWYRKEALNPLFSLNLSYEDFEEEGGQLEGTMMHTIERSVVYAAKANGFGFEKVVMTLGTG